MHIRRLGREGIRSANLIHVLNLPDAAIIAALNMLGLPTPGETIEQHTMSTAEDREAMRDIMPKRCRTEWTEPQRGEMTIAEKTRTVWT